MSSPATPQARGFEFVRPTEHTLDVDGISVTVRPFRVGQFPIAMGLAHPLIDMVFSAAPVVQQVIASSEGDAATLGAGLSPIIMTAIEKHGDTVIELVALATGTDADWVGELYADRLAVLAALVIEVNADFFSRAMPLLKGLQTRVKAFGAPGATPSPSAA